MTVAITLTESAEGGAYRIIATVLCGRRLIGKVELMSCDLVGSGHVSGLFVRVEDPLALMSSADLGFLSP